MGLFTRKERARIAVLESVLEDAEQASLRDRLDRTELLLKAERMEHAAEKANLQGRLDEWRDKAAKWDQLMLGWVWRRGGSVEIDGKKFRLLEARMDNPLANFRLPIPDSEGDNVG